MIEKPQWNASYRVEVLDPQTIALLSERDAEVLNGRVFARIAPLLDGKRSFSDLVDALGMDISPPELMYGLHMLAEKGYVLEGGNGVPPSAAAFWNSMGIATPHVREVLARARVAVSLVGDLRELTIESVGSVLANAGIRSDSAAPLHLVLTSDYLHAELAAIDRDLRSRGEAWLLAKPVGTVLWFGPLFVPDGVCWQCLAQRLRANRQMENFLQRRAPESNGSVQAATASSVDIGVRMAVAELTKYIVGGTQPLHDGLVTFDALHLQTQKHVLTRRPQCPHCGDPTIEDSPKPIVLQSRRKAMFSDGGHRAVRPEATYQRLLPHLSPLTGVISELRDLTDPAWAGIAHSYAASHNFALYNLDVTALMQNIRGRSGGKGASDIQARVSGMSEAIERYSGVYRREGAARRGPMASFEHAIHPSDLMRFSDAQYAGRLEWNREHRSAYHRVPLAFDAQREWSWTPAWSLTHERTVWVPTAYAYYGHPDLDETFFCTADANGCAAGNTLEEAILQGFMELVERDSVALWWYNRVQRPSVDLDSFREPYFDLLKAFYAGLGREIWVLDITSDLGIPAFAAVSRCIDRATEDIVLGFGAHFDAKLAITRALTEVNQFLPSIAGRNADGTTEYWFHDQDAIAWWKTSTLQSDPYVTPSADAARGAGDYINLGSEDLRDEVIRCVEIARDRGLEVVVLDQTQPDIGLPVVKVMIPGMRHFWKRFGPGRLYDIPVELGWRSAPLTEDELNPIGIFF